MPDGSVMMDGSMPPIDSGFDSGFDAGQDAGPLCGDGVLQGTEQCDDRNTVPADGCTTCTLDPGAHDCVPGQVCAVCGNGTLETNEACDDANRTANDGCAADCSAIEPYAVCPVAGQPCEICGDGRLQNVEVCDDHNNTDGDGCSANCATIETNYSCYAGTATYNGYCELCGNRVKDPNETCDDGSKCDDGSACTLGGAACGDGSACAPRSGDGCESTCKARTSTNWTCTQNVSGLSTCYLCGDGIKDPTEVCDDGAACANGNSCTIGSPCVDSSTCGPTAAGGCTANCAGINTGWVCPVGGGACALCNDGTITPGLETCEDGNTAPGDGCSSTCTVEPFSTCPSSGGVPTVGACRVCGDYVVQTGEGCDDGSRCSTDGSFCQNPGGACGAGGTGVCEPHAGDGCSMTCAIEPGWSCPNLRQCGLCGNAIVDSNEVCDDGARCSVSAGPCVVGGTACPGGAGDTCQTVGNDGCEATCQAETPNYDCYGSPSVCEQCGNGIKTAAEPCDDGNNVSGDGCSLSCQVESRWTCEVGTNPAVPNGSSCGLCGDGIVQPSEACDDAARCSVSGDPCTTPGLACPGAAGTCQTANNDGCQADCQSTTTPSWVCHTNTIGGVVYGIGCSLCGDSIIQATEQCDTGVLGTNDGCTDSCQVDTANGWQCPTTSSCRRCGDGVQQALEACDNGGLCSDNTTACTLGGTACPSGGTCTPRNGDGCTNTCTSIEQYYTCTDIVGQVDVCTMCGDGVVQAGEACDDQNHNAADGCSATCAVESGWSCDPGNPSVCNFCGNGIVEGSEVCDDRNAPGGCATGCKALESGWVCYDTGVPSRLFIACASCGNGILEYNETCDNAKTAGNGADDGCDNTCHVATGWQCPDGLSCFNCGDGIRQSVEVCDDAGATGGCNDSCTAVLDFWTCTPGPSGDVCTLCGDGTVQAGEACDDGDHDSGDGCSRTCTIESTRGWQCYTTAVGTGPSTCERCGNGVLDTHELCDDGARCANGTTCASVGSLCADGSTCGTASGDGCSADCHTIAPHYNCFVPGYACVECGNAVVEVGETCDDGPTRYASGDGCSTMCQTESFWQCSIPGQACTRCGDGVKAGLEGCDDGGRCSSDGSACTLGVTACPSGGTCVPTSDDGCSSTCQIEGGYICDGTTCYAARCGDGVRAGLEECDDGNVVPGDGCSGICKAEQGYDCPTTGGACSPAECGDGLVEAQEVCDNGGLCGDNTTACFVGFTSCPTGTCTPRSSDGCNATCSAVDAGYTCRPGACSTTACVGTQNGQVQFPEACDDGGLCSTDSSVCTNVGGPCGTGGTCTASAGDGCSLACGVESGWACTTVNGRSVCNPIVCGDGLVQGTEQCDDENGVTTDGCDACQISPLYTCSYDTVNTRSVCRPIIRFVETLVWNIASLNPNAIWYDPTTRSFIAYKDQSSQPPIELCLDGTILREGGGTGMIDTAPTPARQRPWLWQNNVEDAVYDPVTSQVLLYFGSSQDHDIHTLPVARLGQGQADLPANTNATYAPTVMRDTSGTELTGTHAGMAIGENGQLYLGTDATNGWHRYTRNGTTVGMPFNSTSAAYFAEATDQAIRSAFIIPGYSLLGSFTAIANGTAFIDFDRYAQSGTLTNYAVSDIPGLLFPQIGASPASRVNPSDSSATATDGSGFVICGPNPSEPCSLFAVQCETDADCAATVPGTRCVNGTTASGTPTKYCALQGGANDDFATVGFNSNMNPINVLANDTRSEGICRDSTFRVNSATSPTTRGGTVTVGVNGANVIYTPPTGFCGGVDTFTYTASLGGGLTDTATVSILIACVCGDGVRQSNEQCDNGGLCTDNTTACTIGGAACPSGGTCTPRNGDGCNSSCAIEVVCGDGIVGPGEECDNLGLCSNNTTTCNVGGTTCGAGSTCSARSGDGCSATCQLETVCGNGLAEGVEQCDDGNTISGDGCSSSCMRPVCGDFQLDLDPGYVEQCDDGNNTNGDGCSATCTIESKCGDGTLNAGEQCDDRGRCGDNSLCTVGVTTCAVGTCATVGNDGCSATCTIEFCGDGTAQPPREQCDYADATVGAPPCKFDCTLSTCGDGFVFGTEECDDGNLVNTDACSNTCTANICGNNRTDPNEQCDDGNTFNGDGCSSTCQTENLCGNNVVNLGEQCDDGNAVNTDGCTNACELPACGDTFLQTSAGEQCDPPSAGTCTASCQRINRCGDGILGGTEQCDNDVSVAPAAPMNGDGCDSNCVLEVCGNGVIQSGEQCDDSNTFNGDGCSSTCQTENLCGNGVVNVGEQCDDGNTNNYDSCTNACTSTYCGDGFVNPGEQCDGGGMETATCNVNCTRKILCGDGVIGGTEQCDDGGRCANGTICTVGATSCNDASTCAPVSGDGCRNTCVVEYCGDMVIDAPIETCDDGNTASGDGCSNTCFVETGCGNGVLNAGEQCDDGNLTSGDGCSSSCVNEWVCGDGNVDMQSGEQCDAGGLCSDGVTDCTINGNTPCPNAGTCSAKSSPTCDTSCHSVDFCGNGIPGPGEQCDDGNNVNTDGCRTNCLLPVCGDGIVDAFAPYNEQCDPPNIAARCNSTCQVIPE